MQARLMHHGWTPLHVAAAKLNVKMVDWLMQRGADVNAMGRIWTEQTPVVRKNNSALRISTIRSIGSNVRLTLRIGRIADVT